jgi:2',3'-cyclic-nucleotide 2'-phosphodiesterase (5'-nucleotidase family)
LTILHTNDVHAHQAADADGNGRPPWQPA